MADYISKNILIQAYVHIDRELESIKVKKLETITENLKEFTQERAEFFLYTSTDVEVRIEQGSIKSYVTVLGTIAALYHGIADYKDFKEGTSLIYNDAKRLVDSIAAESLFRFGGKSEKSLRVEARLGVIGSLNKIVRALDRIRFATEESSLEDTKQALLEAHKDIESLLKVLKSEEDRNVVSNGLYTLATKIPSVPRKIPQTDSDRVIVLTYSESRKKLLQSLDPRKRP